MQRLISLELQKLWLNRTSRVLIYISFVLPFFVIILSSLKFNFFNWFTLELGNYGLFNFPIIWHITTFFASHFKLFFAIVVVSMVGNEYSNKTLKQNLIDGLSKKEFILSKFYTIVFFSAIATIIIFIICLSLGLLYSSINEVHLIFREIEFLLAYFVKLVGFFSLCLFLGMLIRRSAFALAFIFVLFILEWIIFWIIGSQSNYDIAWSIHNFMPIQSLWNLIDQPFQRIAISKAPNGHEFLYDFAVHWYEILIVLGWTALFIFLSYKLLKRRDL